MSVIINPNPPIYAPHGVIFQIICAILSNEDKLAIMCKSIDIILNTITALFLAHEDLLPQEYEDCQIYSSHQKPYAVPKRP